MDISTVPSPHDKKKVIPLLGLMVLLSGFLLVAMAGADTSTSITANIVSTTAVRANFSANETYGQAPLCVQFTDTSTGGLPSAWNWSFGDGTLSTDQNPIHIFAAPGTYAITLFVSDLYGTSLPFTSNITVGYPPIPSATFTPPDPMVNTDTVTFDASASTDHYGNITLYTWDFDDGSPLSYSNGTAMTHIFVQPKVCNVTLMVTDNQTFTNTTIVQVPVYAVKTTVTTQVNGTTPTVVNGNQTLDINTSAIQSSGGTVSSTATTLTVQNGNPFWQSAQYFAENVTVNETIGNYTVQNVTQVIMQSAPITATLAPAIGTVSVSLSAALSQYVPDAAVNVSITQGATTSTLQGFQLATTGANISVAYTVQFTNTQQIDTNLTTNTTQAPQAVVLTMSASHDWVAQVANSTNNDGRDSIAIIRYPETGSPMVLQTRFDHYDPVTNLDWFTANSPGGLSIFGLVEYAAQQAAAAPQGGTGQGSQGGTGSSYGSGGGGGQVAPAGPAPQAPQPGPPEPQNIFTGSAQLNTDSAGLLAFTIGVQSADKGAFLTLPQGVRAADPSGQPLSEVTIQSLGTAQVPAVESGSIFTYGGPAYQCGPDGATFDPAIMLAITLNDDQWNSQHANGREPVIREYSTGSGAWETLQTVIDPGKHTIRAQVSHFTTFAVFTQPVQQTAAQNTGPVQTTKPLSFTDPYDIILSMVVWTLGFLQQNLILAVVCVALFCVIPIAWWWYRRRILYDRTFKK
jgi:PKD repeat protein